MVKGLFTVSVSTWLQIPANHLSSDISLSEEQRIYASLCLREPTTRLLYVTPEKVETTIVSWYKLRDYSYCGIIKMIIHVATGYVWNQMWLDSQNSI